MAGEPRHIYLSTRKSITFALHCAALFVFLNAATAFAGTWGAIAFSQSTGAYGYSTGYDDQRGAEKRALAECGAADAKIVLFGSKAWLVLAIGDDTGAYGVAWNEDKREAVSVAKSNAEKYTTGVRVACAVWAPGD